ncbi:MAG: ATP-binding cassette domain-containing protein [Acidobacteriaceae bacterium]|nr:ATP-binding cassette domain-containing protein [Acidobacteriaceae bacterium]
MSAAEEHFLDARLMKRLPPQRDSNTFELNVHLRAGPGITVLFGSSGAGKTLTLNCLAGFTRPDEGRILVRDEIYFDAAARVHVPPQRRRCGYMFQDHALFPHMTVRENLSFAASVARSENNRPLHRHRRVNELLELFELSDLASRTPARLSGGQRQRAALARVLLGEPRLLLLDEPTRGLDARLRSAFYDVLQKTRERLDIPAVLVTHDLEECFELADFVCLIEGGRMLQAGSRESVFAKPASLEVARMLGMYNILPAEITTLDPGQNTSRLAVFDGFLEGPYFPAHLIGDRGSLCVREYEMKVSASKPGPATNAVAVRPVKTTPVAAGIRIEFDGEFCATVSESDWQAMRGSERLWVEVPRAAVHFIG